MNTNANSSPIELALGSIPAELRKRLVKSYADLKSAFVEGRFDACGLRAGKFCEIVLRLLQQDLTGAHTPLGQRIVNFAGECDKLINSSTAAGNESFRILIPRAINFLYTLRNKRDIGHVGGDVDANPIDAATCVRIADWVLCEVIRVKHKLSLEEAQSLVDSIAERFIPVIWEIQGKKRVLNASHGYESQVLLLLYSEPTSGVALEDLLNWTEHRRRSDFITRVIKPLHRARWVEFDEETDFVFISPLGAKTVETTLLNK